MTKKFAIYYGQPLNLTLDTIGLLCFKENPPDDGFNYKRLKIFVLKKENFKRKYENFKTLSPQFEEKLYKFFFNYSEFRREYTKVIYSSLNYRSYKLYERSYPEYLSFDKLLREASALIEAYYSYYSIAVSILTFLFFSKIGLPSSIPKIVDTLYGYDFLDDFFFPVAFPFICYESTNDLLYNLKLEDPLHIFYTFVSFLLWKRAKVYLKLPYYKLYNLGVNKHDLWITL